MSCWKVSTSFIGKTQKKDRYFNIKICHSQPLGDHLQQFAIEERKKREEALDGAKRPLASRKIEAAGETLGG